MNATEARRRVARITAELIRDEASAEMFTYDDAGKTYSAADIRRMERAVIALAARLVKHGRAARRRS